MNAKSWLEIFSEDAVIYDPVRNPPSQVHKDSQKFFKMLSSFFEKMELSKNHVFIVRNGAAVKWTMQVFAKNGRHAISEGISVFEINNAGKIQNVSFYWDEAAMMTKLRS